MGLYYITFRSVTYAQRAEKLLNQWGHRVNLMRTPRWMEEQGCGYALKIWTRDLPAVLKLMQENGVRLRKVYAQREEGDMEEVRL